MLQLIGIKKYVDIHIREKLALLPQKQKNVLNNLSNIFEEVAIVSTCNRTEIYIYDNKDIRYDLDSIFTLLGWSKEYIECCFVISGESVVKHIMEVSCGFHSRILGEDQILGQIKYTYQLAIDMKSIKGILQRLFEQALSCGKKFRTKAKLYEIPVSASSISVIKAKEHGVKNLMIIGYGEVGRLVMKYALSYKFEKIFLVLRDKYKASDILDKKVEILDFNEKNSYLNEVDGIISCTSSPHIIIKRDDINKEGNDIVMFDLAVPRDLDIGLKSFIRVKLYDIDDIGVLDNENRKLRKERMDLNRSLVDEYFDEFNNWLEGRTLSKDIRTIKQYEEFIVNDRMETFKNKCKSQEDIKLASTLIKSTSDHYVNRAISVLKEAKANGCEKECLKIIEKIFMRE